MLDLAILSDSAFSAPHGLKGHILLESTNFEKAVDEFETAVKLDSCSAAARAGLGRALLGIGEIDSAMTHLAEALELDAAYTPALLDMAICHSKKGDFGRTLEFLFEAGRLNPKNPVVHYYMAQEYLWKGRKTEAAESFRRLFEIIYPPR